MFHKIPTRATTGITQLGILPKSKTELFCMARELVGNT